MWTRIQNRRGLYFIYSVEGLSAKTLLPTGIEKSLELVDGVWVLR